MCVYSILLFVLYKCVSFSLFFSLLISILYVNVRNALIKKKIIKKKLKEKHQYVNFFLFLRET